MLVVIIAVIIVIVITGIISTLPHVPWVAGSWDRFPGSQSVQSAGWIWGTCCPEEICDSSTAEIFFFQQSVLSKMLTVSLVAQCPVVEEGSSLDLDPVWGIYNLVLNSSGSRIDVLELSPHLSASLLCALRKLLNLSGSQFPHL